MYGLTFKEYRAQDIRFQSDDINILIQTHKETDCPDNLIAVMVE